MIEKNNAAKTIWHIIEIADLLRKYGGILCEREGITSQQYMIMLYLGGDPNIPYFDREKHYKPMMASELAEAFNVSRPNITNLINNLLKKKLIVQIEDDVDRRKKRLKLSKKGMALVEKLEPSRRAFNENLFENLKEIDRTKLLESLDTCSHTIISHFSEKTPTHLK